MAKKTTVTASGKFGLLVRQPNGKADGWLVGANGVLLYADHGSATRALNNLKKNTRYSWSYPVEVTPYPGSEEVEQDDE